MVGRFRINTPLQPSADASVDLEPSLTLVPSEAGSLIRRHIPHPEELTLSIRRLPSPILVEIRSRASQPRIEFDLIIIRPPSYLPPPYLRVRNFIFTRVCGWVATTGPLWSLAVLVGRRREGQRRKRSSDDTERISTPSSQVSRLGRLTFLPPYHCNRLTGSKPDTSTRLAHIAAFQCKRSSTAPRSILSN